MNGRRRKLSYAFPNTFLSKQLKKISPEKTVRYRAIARGFSQLFAVFTIFIGGVVLLGWKINNYYLISFYPHLPAMETNTAIGLILVGFTLLLSLIQKNKLLHLLYYALSLAILFLGLATLTEHIFRIDLQIDRLFFSDQIALVSNIFTNRMAPNSALIFTCCGFGLLFIKHKKLGKYFGEGSVFLAAVLLLPTVIGYFYGVDFIYGMSTNTKLALPTMIAFVFCISGILLAYVENGYLAVIVSDSTGGFLSRRIILITVILPLIIGWIILIGFHGGLYDQEFRFLLQVAGWIVIFTYVMWINAVSLDKIDLKRKQVEQNAQFLAEASETLSSSLDYKKTLPQVANLATSYICDWCGISLFSENKNKELVTISHRNSGRVRYVTEYLKKNGLDTLVGYSLENHSAGQEEFYPVLTEMFYQRHAKEKERRELFAKLSVSSVMLVPIVVGHKIIGKISFLRSESKREFTIQDLSIVEDLGRRVSLAVYNTKLYNEAQNAVALRDEFISVASHELKTPLTSLKVYIQLIEKQTSLKNQVTAQYLSRMNEQVNKLKRLIEDLLSVSRMRAGKMDFTKGVFDISELVKSVVIPMQQSNKTHHIEIQGVVTKDVRGDRDRIGQVISNLLTNAIRYSPPGSQISVVMSQTPEGVQIAIKDQGVGIDKAHLRRIFDRFYQVNSQKTKSSQGLGIGLYVSKEIIERHKGKIWVESKKGKGSTFTFSLPV